MTIAHLLQDFGAQLAANQPVTVLSEIALEDTRLASFERGYTAGWDDSLKLQSDDKSRVTETLARNLEDLSFTYQEAYSQMLNSVTPIFSAMVDRVLPEMMKDTVGPMIVEQLQDMAGDQAGHPVVLNVPEGYGAALRSVIPTSAALPVTITEDSSLVDGQVYLRIGNLEREVDTGGLMDDIRSAVNAFSFETSTEVAHG